MTKPHFIAMQLGGEFFLETDLYVVAGVSAFITSLSTPLTQLDGSVGIWLLRMAIANLVALTFTAGVFLGYKRYLKLHRNGRIVSNSIVFGFGAILGFIKGAATGLFLWMLGAEQDLLHALTVRVYQSTFLGVVAVVSISVLSLARAKLESDRRLVISELVSRDLRSRGMQVDDAVATLKEFTDSARKKLAAALESPENAEILDGASQAFTKVINDILNQDLRPLSHKLWELESSKISGFSVVELLRISLEKAKVQIWLVLAAFFPVEWLTLIAKYGIWDAFLLATIHAGALVLVLSLSNMLGVKTTKQGALRIFLVPLVSVLISLLASVTWSAELTPVALVMYSFGEFLWICQIVLVSGFLFVVVSAKLQIDQQLSEVLGEIGSNYPLARARSQFFNREMANYLHGSVQNKLIAASLKIQNLEGQDERKQIVDELDLLLANSAENFVDREALGVEQEIAEIASRWNAIVEIDFQVCEESGSKYQLDREVMSQLINEGITNAVRHGIASEISIHVNISSAGCKLTLLDNGIGPRKTTATGLGSRLFTSVAGEGWALTQRAEGGSKLQIVIGP